MQRKGKKGSKSTSRRNQHPVLASGSNTNQDPPSPPYRHNAPVESGGWGAPEGMSYQQQYEQGFTGPKGLEGMNQQIPKEQVATFLRKSKKKQPS